MTEYYDIHTHILPGVDDGSKSMEQSLQMARMAYEQGVRHIVATPHFDMHENRTPVEELKEKHAALKEEIKKQGLDLTLDLGNELLNEPGIIEDLETGRALTMAGTKYILVEFLPLDRYSDISRSLRDYIMHGYIPIIAHMERYAALYKQYDRIEELAKNGCYFQMNTESLKGGLFDRRAAYHRRLVEDGYIQFFGSDCHGTEHRNPLMKDALKRFDPEDELLERILYRNPKKMLAGQYL